jgi:hypothetical protein
MDGVDNDGLDSGNLQNPTPGHDDGDGEGVLVRGFGNGIFSRRPRTRMVRLSTEMTSHTFTSYVRGLGKEE